MHCVRPLPYAVITTATQYNETTALGEGRTHAKLHGLCITCLNDGLVTARITVSFAEF